MGQEIEEIRKNIRRKKITHNKTKTKKQPTKYLTKFLCTIIITLICLIGAKKSTNFKEMLHKNVYEKNFSFATINNLYEKYFGSTLPLEQMFSTKTEPVFSETFTFTKKEEYLDGMKFTVTNKYLMPNIESGMVVFIGEKEGYGNTIIIQQVDGVDIWYSNVESNVKLYDYIEKGDVLGEVNGDYLYMVIKKDGINIKYEEYLQI